MEPIYVQNFQINDAAVDRYGRLKPSMILFYAQEIAGKHCDLLSLDYDSLAQRRMFWAVTRHRVQVTRMPMRGETIRVETWPMPTTKVAFPRSVVAYDEKGQEVFRAISVWVLMNLDTRAMILPSRSGVQVDGTPLGSELAIPGALVPKPMSHSMDRVVRYTDLDRNGHMNNTRYFDWMDDLLPSEFHEAHPFREFTICYHTEALEGDTVNLQWDILGGDTMQVDATRKNPDGSESRVFSARTLL